MSELALFIGPPADKTDDIHAVINFLSENCKKIIIGGSTISIFERFTGCKSTVDLSTTADGLPPYGDLDGITVTEGVLTLKRVNEIFFCTAELDGAAGLVKTSVKSSQRVKIYIGSASNRINGIDKKPVINEFIKNINQSGIKTEIVKY